MDTKRKKNSILSYFAKKTKQNTNDNEQKEKEESQDLLESTTSAQVLTVLWVPSATYIFPLIDKFKERNLRFQYKWLLEFNWLAYSELKLGAFCKFCVLFAKSGGIGCQPLGNLVNSPFTNWIKAKEVFRAHSKTQYHLNSILDSDHFLSVLNKNQVSIVDKLETNRTEQIKLNRSRLIPIIECVVLCGRQELSLRGHRDYGKISEIENQGNFRAILKYRSHGDEFLKNVLETKGYKYITPQIQNEIICICDSLILKSIVKKVNTAKCFSVLADETTDISTTEQLTLCVRFVDESKTIHESFLKFVVIHSLTGSDLAATIINGLISCGINCEFLFGQGYDGASNMSGKYKGVQAIVRKDYPKAIYVHCAAHSLNLAVSNASNIKPIRNCLGIIAKMYDFFNTPKRNNVLLNCIEKSNKDPNTKTLKRLCATRWIQRYDAVSDFFELFYFVIEALELISNNWNDSSAVDASILSRSIDTEFIISLLIVKFIFSFGLPLCKQLQKQRIDLKEAILLASDTIKEIELIRSNADNEFHKVFLQAEEMATSIDLQLSVKRISKRQTNRDNPCFSDDKKLSVEDYYKITIFIPYVDYFIHELKERFLSHSSIFNGFECLFSDSTLITEGEENAFAKLVEFYSPYVTNDSVAELKLWRTKIQRTGGIPNTALEALDACNEDLYPNIYFLLKVLCTLPVSTTTPERMFSTLKRIKTYLRNTMSENRLNGLAMLAVYKNILINAEDVLNELALKPRKINLIL